MAGKRRFNTTVAGKRCSQEEGHEAASRVDESATT
jgi:hypothetical protein